MRRGNMEPARTLCAMPPSLIAGFALCRLGNLRNHSGSWEGSILGHLMGADLCTVPCHEGYAVLWKSAACSQSLLVVQKCSQYFNILLKKDFALLMLYMGIDRNLVDSPEAPRSQLVAVSRRRGLLVFRQFVGSVTLRLPVLRRTIIPRFCTHV